MTADADRLARVCLSRAAEPGDPKVCDKVVELGAEAALAYYRARAGRDDDELAWTGRIAGAEPERELERAARLGIRFVVPGDPEWPASLDGLYGVKGPSGRGGVPVGLWVRGPLPLDRLDGSIAVVGSRSATTYGTSVAHDLSAVVARSGRLVVSGAAYGIDQAAHRGAIAAGGTTVAVLACGADRVYPAAHGPLLAHIADTGAVISESAPGLAPMKVRFLSRNRLIAAMTVGTVLVEAAVRSGALNTAGWAEQLGRPVMGVPGPVTSVSSGGVHVQIRDRGTTLVTSGHEVLERVARMGEHLLEVPRAPAKKRDSLRPDMLQVLEAVPVRQGADTASIARTAGLPVRAALVHLEGLASTGLVRLAEGGWVLTDLARSGE